jgi:hypothetical protein
MRCCHAVRQGADGAATMEHVIPRHPHQERNGGFCWVRSEAILLLLLLTANGFSPGGSGTEFRELTTTAPLQEEFHHGFPPYTEFRELTTTAPLQEEFHHGFPSSETFFYPRPFAYTTPARHSLSRPLTNNSLF